MKKMFTKLFSTALLTGLLMTGITANAQTTDKANKPDADTSFHPVRRLWGYSFGDFYYAAHAEPTTSGRGAETNYSGVPTYRNAFQFRRVYLGYDYDITKKFAVELVIAAEPNANTGAIAGTGTSASNGDNLADSKMA